MRLLLLLVAASVHAVKEKATGFDFPRKNKLGALRGLGVRTKGPIKVYAVGRYDKGCLLYTSPSPRDKRQSRMPSSA